MTKFSNKFKKNYFWPIFPIFGAKMFFQKIWFSHAQHHRNPNNMVSFRKNLMSRSQENFQTERRRDSNSKGPSNHGHGFIKRLWHKCFPVNFAKFLRTPFFTEHLRWLLLKLHISLMRSKRGTNNFSLKNKLVAMVL